MSCGCCKEKGRTIGSCSCRSDRDTAHTCLRFDRVANRIDKGLHVLSAAQLKELVPWSRVMYDTWQLEVRDARRARASAAAAEHEAAQQEAQREEYIRNSGEPDAEPSVCEPCAASGIMPLTGESLSKARAAGNAAFASCAAASSEDLDGMYAAAAAAAETYEEIEEALNICMQVRAEEPYMPSDIDILRVAFTAWQVSLTMARPSNVPASDLRWATPLDHPGRAPRLLGTADLKVPNLSAPYRV
jgi:hypothetical protein